MAELPMHYRSAYEWDGTAADGTVTIVDRPPLALGTPHDVGRFSPEDLLLVAAEACLANYVVLIARKSKLGIHAYRSESEADLERDEKGVFRFKRILIRTWLQVDADAARLAHKVVQKAHRLCLVANSLRCPVEIDVRIEH